MVYLTKEWFVKYNLSYAVSAIRVSKEAEVFDEDFFQKLYQKKCKIFVDNDRHQDFFRDPQEDLKRCDEMINEPGISEEKKKALLAYKEIELELNKERYESGKIFSFDEDFAKEKFDVWHQQFIKFYSYLPEYILNEIPDIRVLALGCTSRHVKNLMRDYAKNLRKETKKTLGKAQSATNKAEKKLAKLIGANEYEEIMLERIYKSGSSIMLCFDCGTLKFCNGQIVEREEKRLNHYNKSNPHSGWSMVMNAEVSYNNGLFELHLLMDNLNKKGQSKLWYLTVSGTDIIECKGSNLSYTLNI